MTCQRFALANKTCLIFKAHAVEEFKSAPAGRLQSACYAIAVSIVFSSIQMVAESWVKAILRQLAYVVKILLSACMIYISLNICF
jgi:hypothetical protein